MVQYVFEEVFPVIRREILCAPYTAARTILGETSTVKRVAVGEVGDEDFSKGGYYRLEDEEHHELVQKEFVGIKKMENGVR